MQESVLVMTVGTDSKVERLRTLLKAVEKNLDIAIACHEVWKPTAYDEGLHERLGVSLASQAFGVIRSAVRREMLLALTRIWDTQASAQSLNAIVLELRKPATWDALLKDRTSTQPIWPLVEHVEALLIEQRNEVFSVHNEYGKDGPSGRVLKGLVKLRHGTLAHTQAAEAARPKRDPTDEQIDAIYRDTIIAVSKLSSLINGVAIDHASTGHVCAHYASRFWAGVRGENTEGHPNFRAPLAPRNT